MSHDEEVLRLQLVDHGLPGDGSVLELRERLHQFAQDRDSDSIRREYNGPCWRNWER